MNSKSSKHRFYLKYCLLVLSWSSKGECILCFGYKSSRLRISSNTINVDSMFFIFFNQRMTKIVCYKHFLLKYITSTDFSSSIQYSTGLSIKFKVIFDYSFIYYKSRTLYYRFEKIQPDSIWDVTSFVFIFRRFQCLSLFFQTDREQESK
jgi:hypothetical protein